MSAATIAASGPLLAAIAVSAAAGAISFATPCVLPLIPGYLAVVSGLSGANAATAVDEAEVRARSTPEVTTLSTSRLTSARTSTRSGPRRTVVGAALFVLGFTTIFTLLGGAFGTFGHVLSRHRQLIEVFGGLLVLAMGLVMLGVLRPPALQRDRRPWRLVRGGGLAAAFPLGIVFGAGWTPCIGPTLASILTLSAVGEHTSATRGAILAFAYSLGLGAPLIAVALGVNRAVRGVSVLRRHARRVETVGGVLLIVIGLLLVTGLWNTFLSTFRPWVGHFTSPL